MQTTLDLITITVNAEELKRIKIALEERAIELQLQWLQGGKWVEEELAKAYRLLLEKVISQTGE